MRHDDPVRTDEPVGPDERAHPDGPADRPALSAATLRAYRGDLADVSAWCARMGIAESVLDLDERHVFAYLVDQVRLGRSAATIRRRVAAVAGRRNVGGQIDRRRLADVERLIASGVASRTAVLVASDDPIFRAGVRAVLTEAGVLCWSDPVAAVEPATIRIWDFVLVRITSADGIDPFGPIGAIRALGAGTLATVPVVAVAHPGVGPMVRLRLAEAGVRYLLPDTWLAEHLDELADRLRTADIPIRYHLDTPLAIRQSLGLALAGDLATLLDAARALPDAVWRTSAPLPELPVSRAEVRRLRTLALTRAGVPAPDFARFASSLRPAPTTPEWATVRAVVRAAFALDSDEEPS